MRNEVVLMGYVKCMVSMATPSMILVNRGRPKKSILSRGLLMLEH